MSTADFIKIMGVKWYSKNTIDSYVAVVKMTQNYFQKPLSQIDETALHKYFHFMVHTKKVSYSYQKQIAMALKLYYKEMFNTGIHLELIDLKISDVDSTRMEIHIKSAKDNKDRILSLSKNLLKMLRNYHKKFSPQGYLFEGQKGGKYSTSTFNKLLKKAAKRAKINDSITAHTLRHSYATHLREKGTDIRVIQKLLGHRSIKTTLLYTQMSEPKLLNVTSPFDD